MDNTADIPATPSTGRPRARHWYVALVGHNAERTCAERVGARGLDTYVPTQRENRVWRDGRRATVDRVVIPGTVFIRCSEAERREIVAMPCIRRFLTDRASGGNAYGRRVAIIPDRQIERLRFMLGHSDVPVEFVGHVFSAGERVRVVRGSLRGLEGTVRTGDDGRSTLTVTIDFLGGATVTIDPIDLAPAK